MKDQKQEDIIDETIKFFRPNVLFKSYEILGEADRTLLYLSFYVSLCLRKIEEKKCKDKASADKILFQLAQDRFQAPGETGFVLGGFFAAPKSGGEGSLFFFNLKLKQTGQII
jgi:actin related protein 2/3 complex, subunit 3